MSRITRHPILDVPKAEETSLLFEGKEIRALKGFTIAAALHNAGYPVHSHSLTNRNRSLECGIGKCGACEMWVDGEVKRICITKVDGVKEVRELLGEKEIQLHERAQTPNEPQKIRTRVAIIGAGPAGLAAREELNKAGVDNLVIDANEHIGGQFLMQTHQFFFFEKEQHFGGQRGFEIARSLAGNDHSGIMLGYTVWDILEGNWLVLKKISAEEKDVSPITYIHAEQLIIATGAVPFVPAFENDDLPGVYTAAVVQKMMNQELTLLGKNILTVGAGNIGYLTSYQLMQAGATVKAIIEAQPDEGGFPVQANRIRRLGIPIITGKTLIKIIPNEKRDGIKGAVVADAENFQAIPGTEQVIDGIDAVNICTGLVQDDLLFTKGKEVFGRNVHAAGDAQRIGEGTTAVLRGKQVAMEVLEALGLHSNYDQYLAISKKYIDSQQHPIKVMEEPEKPTEERQNEKPFVIIDCLYGFACNPCTFACPHGAITKTSTSTVPRIDYDKCTGCMQCISKCPGQAIFGYNPKKNLVFLPCEFDIDKENVNDTYLVDNNGNILRSGTIEKILSKPNKTNVVRVKAEITDPETLMEVRGFILKKDYPEPLSWKKSADEVPSTTYICHCEDVTLEDVMKVIGNRSFVDIDEIKHTTRLGMGACRGKRCVKRLKTALKSKGISILGEPTPRGPMSNQVSMGELLPLKGNSQKHLSPGLFNKQVKKVKVSSLIAGGGIGGSALFRYLAESELKPILVNSGHGSSWRNIAGGRPAFSIAELADIASRNLELFRELQQVRNIDFRHIRYVTFAHDESTYQALKDSMTWQDAEFVEKADFPKKISPYFNPHLDIYPAALITNNCWQSTPGKVIDTLRALGMEKGGTIEEDCKVLEVARTNTNGRNSYKVLVHHHSGEYVEYETDIFINAMGMAAGKFARQAGLGDLGIFPVKHQAFITRRLPNLGLKDQPLPMLIDRRKYKGFMAVYGQQLADTGQIIGCASPINEPMEARKNLKTNSRDFMEIVSEVFVSWIPQLADAGLQAVWSGYYVEPRMIVDPEHGLFVGLRGQGYMLAQYLAKMYVDKLVGRPVPEYFTRLSVEGDGLKETAFK